MQKFTKFLVELVESSRCYPQWVHFKGIFPRLVSAGGTSLSPDLKEHSTLLENLANTPQDSVDGPDVTNVSTLVRTRFFNTTLYESFVQHRVGAALDAAQKSSNTNQQRLDLLRPWQNAAGLTTSTNDTIDTALQLWDNSTSLDKRIIYMRSDSNGLRSKMAMHWDPAGQLGASAKIFQDTPDLSMVQYLASPKRTLSYV